MTPSDPRREPSWDPAPRKRIMGISIPPQPTIPQSVRSPSKGTKVGVAGGAVLTLAIAFWQGLPAIISSAKESAQPSVQQNCATQDAMEQAQRDITVVQSQTKRLSEFLCAMNEGSPGPDWPCDLQAYQAPMRSPPKLRTDRVFPSK